MSENEEKIRNLENRMRHTTITIKNSNSNNNKLNK